MEKKNSSLKNKPLIKRLFMAAVIIAVVLILDRRGLLGNILNFLGGGEESGAYEESLNVNESKKNESRNESKNESKEESKNESKPEITVKKGKNYYSKDEVALYLKNFGELPPNFITKNEAEALGWDNKKGNLWKVTDKKCIGGDVFSNREGILPKANNRKWYECDVNYNGGYRGSERILYSSDGLIYYTDDHYETATRLY